MLDFRTSVIWAQTSLLTFCLGYKAVVCTGEKRSFFVLSAKTHPAFFVMGSREGLIYSL